MSSLGDIYYKLGANVRDLFRDTSPEDRELAREKDKQKAFIEEQNKARLAQLLVENDAYAARQKAQLEAQRGMMRENQEMDAARDLISNVSANERQQAGFKHTEGLAAANDAAAGERALLARELHQKDLLENPALAAKGQVAAGDIAGSDADVQRMNNRFAAGLLQGNMARLSSINLDKDLETENSINQRVSSMELDPGRNQIEKNRQGVLLAPENQKLLTDMIVGLNLGQGETRFSPNNMYMGSSRGSGLHRLADGTMVNSDYTNPASVRPAIRKADLIDLAADRAAIKADKPVAEPIAPKPITPKPLTGTRLPAGSKVADWEKTPALGEEHPLATPRGWYGGPDWSGLAKRDYGLGNYINLDKDKPDIERRLLKEFGNEISSGVDVKTKNALDPLTRNFLHSRSNALYNAINRR